MLAGEMLRSAEGCRPMRLPQRAGKLDELGRRTVFVLFLDEC